MSGCRHQGFVPCNHCLDWMELAWPHYARQALDRGEMLSDYGRLKLLELNSRQLKELELEGEDLEPDDPMPTPEAEALRDAMHREGSGR